MHKDFEEKECPYFESDTLEMFDKLLEKGLVKLPYSSRPEEIRKVSHDYQSSYREVQSIQKTSPTTCKRRKNHIRRRRHRRI